MAGIDLTSGSASAYGAGELQLQNKVQMTATLTPVTDNLNVASPLLLSTSLVQTLSTLKITTADNPYLDAEDNSGNNRFTIGRDPASQQVNLDFASNPTGSTTAVGAIRTYRDGVNLSEAMTFIEDGSIGIGTNAPIGLLHLYKSAAATRLAIDGDAGQNRLISYRTGAVQRFGLYVNNTAESGTNAGSNFAIRAYSDAGALLTTPLFINRATGNVGVNTTTGTAKLQVVGSGSTSATTSLLVQNSTPSTTFSVNDAGDTTTLGNATFGGGFVQVQGAGGSGIFASTYNSVILRSAIAWGLGNNTGTIGSTNGTINYSSAFTSNVEQTNILRCSQMMSGVGEGRFVLQAQANAGGYNAIGNMYIAGGRNTNGGADGNVYLGVDLTGALGNVSVGTNSINASAKFQIDSTTQGFLPPRMTTAQKVTLAATAAAGLMIYDTNLNKLCVYTGAGWETITSI